MSGKFHTIFGSFAIPKASYIPGGAAVAPSLNVLAWGAMQVRKSCVGSAGSQSCLSRLIFVCPVEVVKKL